MRLADNVVSDDLIDATPGGGLGNAISVDNYTIANNAIGTDYVMQAQLGNGSTFTLTNTIIDQGGHPTIDYQGPSGALVTQYLLSNDVSTLIQDGTIFGGVPTYVDAANGNYHLQPTSPGVDFAPAGTSSTDLDGNPRVVDLSVIANRFGPMDLGAYEVQTASACLASDTIFCNGFEGN